MLKVYLLLIALLGFQTLKSHANQLSEAQMYFPSSIPDSTFNTPMPSISSLNRQQINSKEPMIVYLPIQSQIPNTPPQFAPYVLHANGEIFTLAATQTSTPQISNSASNPNNTYDASIITNKQNTNSSSMSKRGHSSWFWLFILLLVVSGYIGIGYWYNNKTDGLTGYQALPHIEFWALIPEYVAAGCNYSLEFFHNFVSNGAHPSPAPQNTKYMDEGTSYNHELASHQRLKGSTTNMVGLDDEEYDE